MTANYDFVALKGSKWFILDLSSWVKFYGIINLRYFKMNKIANVKGLIFKPLFAYDESVMTLNTNRYCF